MTTNYLSPIFNEQTFDSSGSPLVGGQIETYVAGTSTPLATYTTQSGTTQQANPIILNARGETANPIWLGAGQLYKFILKDSLGAVLRTIDNVGGINDASLSVSEWQSSGYTPTYISTVSFSVVGDKTGDFEAGRRIRSTNSGGTIYSTISSSSYSSGTGLTTVTVRNDSGTLDAGLSSVDIGLLTAVNPSLPNSQTVRQVMGLGYGEDIASATIIDFTTRTGNIVRITGTTATTGVTLSNGGQVWCYAVGAWPLTYHATNMPLPGAASYTCAAGDIIKFTKDKSGALSVEISKLNGTPMAIGNGTISAAKLDGAQSGSAPIFGARAFVRFDATTGTPVIKSSGNVSTISDNGIGYFSVNFTTNMADANYDFNITIGTAGGSSYYVSDLAPLANTLTFKTRDAGTTQTDLAFNNVTIFS